MNQAHGMRLEHPIFHGPLSVSIELEEASKPENYDSWPGGAEMPAKIPVWTVQTASYPAVDPGLVSDSFGFEDSPDAEWISSGINSKGPTSLALGRHANLFLWGFSADPTQLTESGKRVFVNTICWMKQFDGARPLITAKPYSSRDWALVYAGYISDFGDDASKAQYIERSFPKRVLESVGKDGEQLATFYRENLEYLIRTEHGFDVDDDLKVLGAGNRSPSFLPALIARWTAAPADELCARLAARYVDEPAPRSAAELREWYEAQRDRLFFSDCGGFKWCVDTRPERAAPQEKPAPGSPAKR
jgi:hypothetical protein